MKVNTVLRAWIVLIVAVLLSSTGTAFAAGQTKVDVCHAEGNGSYTLINISEAAFPAHIDHGDASPGEAVPGMEGYDFSADCNPVPAATTVTITTCQVGGQVFLVDPGDTLIINVNVPEGIASLSFLAQTLAYQQFYFQGDLQPIPPNIIFSYSETAIFNQQYVFMDPAENALLYISMSINSCYQ